MRRSTPRALVLLLALVAVAEPSRAETVRSRVRDHVGEELQSPRRGAPPRKQRPAPPRKPARDGSRARAPAAPAGEQPVPEPASPQPDEPPRPRIPRRVIGKNFQLDPRVGGGLRGWVLQQYPSVDVAARGYATWSVEAKARLFRWVNLHRGYFESTGLTAPRHRGATLAADVGEQIPRAAWVLGTIGVPVSRVVEPIIRYEARAFRTVASPSRPVRVVPHGTSPDVDLSTIAASDRPLALVSGFETLVAGVRIDPSRKAGATIDSRGGRMPVFTAGLGLTAYSKPYQVSVGDAVLDDVLFDARFRGAGLAFGVELPPRPDQLQLDVAGQVGLGEVRLLEDLTLNSLLPETRSAEGLRPPEWLIGYVQGDVTVGYVHTLLATEPSVLVSAALTGGGATFFYFKTQVEEGEPVDAPPLNWDFLWGVRAAVTVPL